jgi:transposase-like protein
MTQAKTRDPVYRRRRFEGEIIELCVRWYITYRLSHRDLVAMMAERGLSMSHTTILRWLPQSIDDDPTVVAAKSDARRKPVESSSTEAVATGESTVARRVSEDLSIPQ